MNNDSVKEQPIATPSSHWSQDGQSDPHGGRYDCERAGLIMGSFSDDELANGAYLNYDRVPSVGALIAGKAFSPMMWMTGVKDRIRWLSRQLQRFIDAQAVATSRSNHRELLERLRACATGQNPAEVSLADLQAAITIIASQTPPAVEKPHPSKCTAKVCNNSGYITTESCTTHQPLINKGSSHDGECDYYECPDCGKSITADYREN